MKRIIYNYQFNQKYSLQKINIYAYSFFATIILDKIEEENDKFNIDLDSIISNISDSLLVSEDPSLDKLRYENHDNYYRIDTKFIKEIDDRYKKYTDSIMEEYLELNSHQLLSDDYEEALNHKNIITKINKKIDVVKEQVKEDLMTIMSYVDNDEKELDLTFLDDDNEIANKLKNRYNALLLYKSVINMDNINHEMKRQKTRLALIRQLIPLTKRYKEKRNLYIKDDYDDKNIKILKDNLSIIVSEYIFLLSIREFNDLKKVYQGLLDNDYTYITEFMYDYKIIMDKIWKHCLSDYQQYHFDFLYLVTEKEIIDAQTMINCMNRNNMDNYGDIGYICTYEGNLFDVFDINSSNLLELPLPSNLEDSYQFKVKEPSKVHIVAKYNKSINDIGDTIYPVVEIR